MAIFKRLRIHAGWREFHATRN